MMLKYNKKSGLHPNEQGVDLKLQPKLILLDLYYYSQTQASFTNEIKVLD